MIGVAELSGKRAGLILVLGVSLFGLALDFVLLVVTYLVLASSAPDVLGEVALSPARFAAWIALVKLPMALAHMVAVSWRGWMALVTTGDVPDPPARTGPRRTLERARDSGADAAWSVIAALIVFHHVADPGTAHFWRLIAVTALGPFLLPKIVEGLFRLLRGWWRRRHNTTHGTQPHEEPIEI